MGLIGKMATVMIGRGVAAEAGKAGLAGMAASMVATRVMTRSPMGVLLIGAAYIGHKLWQKKKEIDSKGAYGAAVEDGLIEPGTPPVDRSATDSAPTDRPSSAPPSS